MHTEPVSIMVAETGRGLADRVRRLFPEPAARVVCERDPDRVIEFFENESCDVLLASTELLRKHDGRGQELLQVVMANSPATKVLLLAMPGDIRMATAALKAGAFQYARHPVSDEELKLCVEHALAGVREMPRHGPARGRSADAALPQLTGRSEKMQNVYRQIRQAAATDIPVLLQGETGTGKDLAAQAIHAQSRRAGGPYVPVHLGALPADLVAAELFGHEKGAFTGATERRIGKFEQGHTGTVFLDEISAIDEKVQVSLLRLLEKKRFHRLGGRKMSACDVRLIAATNENLEELVAAGRFREDLFYRLDVFRIVMPPLRERQGDIPLLIEEFLKRYNRDFGRRIAGISPECISLFEAHEWPGNVRELKNVIQRGVLVCTENVLLPQHLPARFRPERLARAKVTFEVGTPLSEVEREMVLRALAAAGNNRKRAAELLGISRRSLYNKIAKYRID
ncbi:MAG: sigma-54-dependent Fis family transcriptional regulator [Kiritimatiellae bacterium]|nr:sigma-54-dependent Fis family transcriptional regulator [Kiritimatiellia bacterium]